MHSQRLFRSFLTTSHILLIIALVGALLAAPTRVARAATLDVDINNESCDNASGKPYCNIQPAIDDAQPGDIINVASGQYGEFLTIGKSLTIAGAGAGKTVIDGGLKGRVVNIDGAADVTIAGVTIRQGIADNGAGIRNASTLTLRDSEVAGNQADGSGGGIFSSGTLILTSSTIDDNRATGSGGGIFSSGAVALTNSTISGNQATGNGGGIFSSGLAALASATVAANSSVGSESQGGGIYHSGERAVTLRNTILARNNGNSGADCSGTLTSQGYNLVSDDSGCGFQATEGDKVGRGDGAIDPLLAPLAANGGLTPTHALEEGSPAIDAGSPTSCPATDQRGVARPQGLGCDIGAYEAAAVAGETRYVSPNGSDGGGEFQNNCLDLAAPCRTIVHAIGQASAGDTISIAAGIYQEHVSLDDNMILEGAGAGATMIDGGGQGRVIAVNPNVTARISGVRIQNGNTTNQDLADGGGIRNDGTLILSRSAVSGNTSGGRGGGIYNGGVLALDDSRVQGNSAGGGGGIYGAAGGSLTINRSTIGGNRSQGAGGGIQNDGTLTLVDSTISGNLAVGRGGGVDNNNTLAFTNATISGNRAERGGGLANGGGGANLGATTVADNHANIAGGGIVVDDGTVNLRSTIVAGNTGPAAPDCAGAPTSQGNNLMGDTSGCGFTATPSDLTGQDPRLGALRDNGGATFTQAIPPDSPAANAGDSAACAAADQRGTVRPQGSACDIGAYEVRVFRPRPLEFGDRDAPHLVFTAQPTGTVAGQELVPAPVVAVRDALGNPAGYTGSITLTLVNNANIPGAALSGTTVLTPDSAGVARFTGLSINAAGTGYQLRAEATGVLSAESALMIVALAQPPSEPEPEHEPNNTIEQPNELVFDASGFTARVGLITTTDVLTPDVDVFSFWARPGSTMAITLTGRDGGELPADYDVLIAPDPRSTLYISDEIDLDNLADLPRGGIPRGGIPRGGIPRGGIPRGGIPRGGIGGISENIGLGSEKISGYLPTGGQYFVMVYGGTADQLNAEQQYLLDVTVQDSPLVEPTFRAHPIAQLNLVPDRDVRTIYVEHPLRLEAHYPGPEQAPALGALASAVSPGSGLLAADGTVGKGKGATIDLRAALQPDDYNDLVALYNQWDEQGQQPLLANEAAQQIWFVLDRALTTYYTGTTDIVLVGGDDILPFYRVPDETELANESEYVYDLGDRLDNASPLGGSLFYHFIQTDNFYADRRPTPWRGRALYLPDMGLGRLVEQPTDIMHYLNGYLASANYTIDAKTPPVADTGVLVTGYDFLIDQAEAISSTFETLGFKIGGSPALSTTIGTTWNAQDLADQWFSGQLDRLRDGYNPNPEQPDIYTRYHLTALNGHFDHAATVPATGTEVLSASLLLTPTAAVDSAAFFKIDGAPTLIYSVGCHSGLNAADDAISDPEFQADFPQMVLKHGGNWIGNTGYGIGDTDLIGYSEKLSLKFTEAIGREITDTLATDPYVGAPIGRSLASAKIEYLRSAGSNTFSIYDEKILAEMTLYGLPFIRVKVPQPLPPPDLPAIPESTWKPRLDAEGMFTRIVTLETSFITSTLLSGDQVVRASSVVSDEFRTSAPVTATLKSEDQTPLGRPVLPLMTYDITLQADRSTASGPIPVPRGVRLLSVETLEDVDDFDPHVTYTISDEIQRRQDEPPLTEQGVWSPGVPFATQRTAEDVPGVGVQLTDRLLVYPVQFNAGNQQTGRLRRFSRMVFEITYLDPTAATQELQSLRQGPRIALAAIEDTAGNAANCDPEADLSGELIDDGRGRIVNTSADCSYNIGLASYRAFDQHISKQKLFDSTTATILPGQTRDLMVGFPDCATQIDLFYGSLLLSLDGQRYGQRLLDSHFSGGRDYCPHDATTSTPGLAQTILPNTVRLVAVLSDESGRGIKEVSTVYTTDGVSWQRAVLTPSAQQAGRWEAVVPANGTESYAFFMASDNAGHVSVVAANGAAATGGHGVRVRPAHAAHFGSVDFYLDDQLLDDSLDSREVQEYLDATPGVHRVYLRPEHSHPTSPVLFSADTPPLLDGHDYTLIVVGRPGALGLVVVDETAPAPPPGQSLMHFVNANRTEPGWDIGPIDVYLDGALQAAALPVGQTSAGFITVAPGTHTVWFFQAGRDPDHDRALYRKTFVVNAGELLLVGTGRHDDDDGDLSDFEQRAFIGRAAPR